MKEKQLVTFCYLSSILWCLVKISYISLLVYKFFYHLSVFLFFFFNLEFTLVIIWLKSWWKAAYHKYIRLWAYKLRIFISYIYQSSRDEIRNRKKVFRNKMVHLYIITKHPWVPSWLSYENCIKKWFQRLNICRHFTFFLWLELSTDCLENSPMLLKKLIFHAKQRNEMHNNKEAK